MATHLFFVDPNGKKSPIAPGWNTVGSSDDCDIIIPGADPKHLVLQYANDVLTLRAPDTPKPADPFSPLTETDIRAAVESRRTTPAATLKTAPLPNDEVILADTFSDAASPLPKPPSPGLVLPEKTFLNGKKTTPGATISAGDRLRMNDVTLTVSTDARSVLSRLWSRRLVRYPVYGATAGIALFVVIIIALHIFIDADAVGRIASGALNNRTVTVDDLSFSVLGFDAEINGLTIENLPEFGRSEERRVGKECRSRW